LQKRIYDIQERFLRRDATLGAMAEAGELSEFMFSICDNASTAKAIKEVCGILNIEVDDFFATYGYDPSEDDEEEEDEDEEGEEGEEDFDEEEEEEEEAPEPPPPPEPKKARRKSPLLDNDLIQ
jgi:cobalamin biosynthesis protein CobT